jgi:hypothetical protein
MVDRAVGVFDNVGGFHFGELSRLEKLECPARVPYRSGRHGQRCLEHLEGNSMESFRSAFVVHEVEVVILVVDKMEIEAPFVSRACQKLCAVSY